MNNYLQDILKSNGERKGLMNYEWARFESYKTFPPTSNVSPMRLAQAGFYYSGEDEGGICFSCGLRNKIWNDKESAKEVHKRLSPNCDFMSGNDQTNVPIHTGTGIKSNCEQVKPSTGACGGLNDTILVPVAPQNGAGRNAIVSNEVGTVSNDITSERSSGEYNEVTQSQSECIQSFFGATFVHPKHPDYAVLAVRHSSYAGWSYGHILEPAYLAEAGFFYTGVSDCVRCFCCGCGLKDWIFGDNPWVEHAKWYPRCPFLIQCKGYEFASMYGQNGSLNMRSGFEKNASAKSKQNKDRDQTPRSSENFISDIYEDMSSDVVKIILETGYSHEEIVMGITVYRKKFGAVPLRTHELLEFILDNQVAGAHSKTATSSSELSEVHDRHHNMNKRPSQTNSLNASEKCDKASEKELNVTGSETSSNGARLAIKDYQSLLDENRALREQVTCKICMDKEACIVFLPCGHMVSCIECARALRKCAICRKAITRTVRSFPA